MTLRIAGLFLVAAVALLPRPALAADAAAAEDNAEVVAVISAFANAWNEHDMVKFSRLFTSDADWVNVRGNRWTGVDQIRDNHVAIHDRFYARSRLKFSEVSVRRIAPDIALVHAKETITGSAVPAAAGLGADSQMSLVIVRRGAEWLITSGHNTNIAPAPSSSD
ncbi:MAG: SgcJ/EcaC family oxidoreductase [Luteimonas sp.]